MKHLYILGAGGFAREIYSYIKVNGYKYKSFNFKGFLSDNSNDLDSYKVEHQILGRIKTEIVRDEDAVIIGVSNCEFKKELYDYYQMRGINILSYVHESAFIGHNVKIGKGSVICPQVVLTADIEVGDAVTINAVSTVGHDASIGSYSTLSGHCDVTGGVELGASVFMGSHSSVIPKVKVGDAATIGAGSLVISKVKAGSTVFGNPAKKIK